MTPRELALSVSVIAVVGLLQAPIRELLDAPLSSVATLVGRAIRAVISMRRQVAAHAGQHLRHVGLAGIRWPIWIAAVVSTLAAGVFIVADFATVAASLEGLGMGTAHLPAFLGNTDFETLLTATLLLSLAYAAAAWEATSDDASHLMVAEWHSDAGRRFLRGSAGLAFVLGILVVVALGVQRARALSEVSGVLDEEGVEADAGPATEYAPDHPLEDSNRPVIDAIVVHLTTIGSSTSLALSTVVATSFGPAYLLRLGPLALTMLAGAGLWVVERALRITHTLWLALATLVRRTVHALLAIAIAVARPVHTAATRLHRWATVTPPDSTTPWSPGLAPVRGLLASLTSPVLDLPLPRRAGVSPLEHEPQPRPGVLRAVPTKNGTRGQRI